MDKITPPSCRTLPDGTIQDVVMEGRMKIGRIRDYMFDLDSSVRKLYDIDLYNCDPWTCSTSPSANIPCLLSHLTWVLEELAYRARDSHATIIDKQGELF